MKNNIKKTWVIVVALALGVMGACSDGSLESLPQAPAPSISASGPLIIGFSADPAQVKAGQGTKITWKVANADSVEIKAVSSLKTDTSLDFHVETDKAEGSQAVTALNATTDFILTATKNAAAPAAEGDAAKEGEAKKTVLSSGDDAKAEDKPAATDTAVGAQTATQTITVNVTSDVFKSGSDKITFSSSTAKIAAGDKAIIKWEVLIPSKSVNVTDADGNEVTPTFAGADCEETDAEALLSNGEPQEAAQAKGCAVVEPEVTTTYTVAATTETDSTETSTITIEVGETTNASVSASITVNDTINAELADLTQTVTVKWSVLPQNAAVTVTATPQASCTPALPQGADVDYTSSECKLSALPTKFAIKAVSGSATKEATASVAAVSIGGDKGNTLVVSPEIDIKKSTDWAFEGEEVTFEITAKSGTDASAIKEIKFNDKSGVNLKKVSWPVQTVKIIAPKQGISIEMVDKNDKTRQYDGVNVVALHFEEVQAEAITALGFDSASQSMLAGVRMAKYNGGKSKIYASGGWKDFDFGAALEEAIGLDASNPKARGANDKMLDDLLKTFPINVVTARIGKSNELYAGTTGTIMYSKNGGKTFKHLQTAMRISEKADDPRAGDHATCRGLTQKGNPAHVEKELVSLNQICDIAVGAGGRMILATDDALFAVDSIDKFSADAASAKVFGKGNALYRVITDDVECMDDDCQTVVAATEKGVYKTTNGGESWEDLGGLGKRAFSVTIVDGKVFAGTADGIYINSIVGGDWTQAGLAGKKVTSLAKDSAMQKGGYMILAGTSDGTYISRDTAKTWAVISTGTCGNMPYVAFSSAKEGSGRNISVAIAAGNTVASGSTILK